MWEGTLCGDCAGRPLGTPRIDSTCCGTVMLMLCSCECLVNEVEMIVEDLCVCVCLSMVCHSDVCLCVFKSERVGPEICMYQGSRHRE